MTLRQESIVLSSSPTAAVIKPTHYRVSLPFCLKVGHEARTGDWARSDRPAGERIVALAKEAESLGYDTIWAPEIYGADCFTPLTWIAAHTERINVGSSIMQISARTPASAAMHAVSLDYLSNGRLILGIGVSGPQVVEGWYGQPYPKPLARTREWVAIFRKIVSRRRPRGLRRQALPASHAGRYGPLANRLSSSCILSRERIPVYLGAEGPEERRDGCRDLRRLDPDVPLSPYRMMDMYADAMRIKNMDFEIAASVPVIVDDDVDRALMRIKQNVGFYVGGMGAKSFKRPQGPHLPHGIRRRGAACPGPVHGPAVATRPWPPSRMICATKSRSSARRRESGTDSRPGRRVRSPC